MKTVLPSLFLVTCGTVVCGGGLIMVMGGCGRPAAQNQTADLEARVLVLEQTVAQQNIAISNLEAQANGHLDASQKMANALSHLYDIESNTDYNLQQTRIQLNSLSMDMHIDPSTGLPMAGK